MNFEETFDRILWARQAKKERGKVRETIRKVVHEKARRAARRERYRPIARARHAERMASDPEYRETMRLNSARDYAKNRFDPAYMARKNESARKARARRLAKVKS